MAVNGSFRCSVLPASKAHSTTNASPGSPNRARAAARSTSGGAGTGSGTRWTGTGATAAIDARSKREFVHTSSTSANDACQSARNDASSHAQTAMV